MNRGGLILVPSSKGNDYSEPEVKGSSLRNNEEKSFCYYKGDGYKCQSKGCKDCCLCHMTQRFDHQGNRSNNNLFPDAEKQGVWKQRFMARYPFYSTLALILIIYDRF